MNPPRPATDPPRPGWGALELAAFDLAHALRQAVRRPGFSLAVIVTLALGIGANTAVFALIESVILSPLPYADSDELYGVLELNRSEGVRVASYPTFEDWRAAAAFADMAYARGTTLTYRTPDQSGILLSAFVTDGFFDVMAMPAALGRTLVDADYAPDAGGAVVLSHRAWSRWFGADPGVLGSTLVANELPFTVVGVMPPTFAYPDWGVDNDLWLPITRLPPADQAALRQRGFNADSRVVARIGGGTSVEVVQERMDALAASLADAHPELNRGWTRVQLTSLKEREVGGVRVRLFVLASAVGLVLLICCLNLGNLYLVDGTRRRPELALRAALGADAGRLFRQLLLEAALLVTVGAALGIVLASWGLARVTDGALADLPRVHEVGMSPPVLAFAGLLAGGTALLFAWVASRSGGASGLRAALSGTRVPRHLSAAASWGAQAAQVAVTFVLLVGAWLLTETLLRLDRVDPGFEPAGLVVVPINPPSPAYDDADAAVALYRSLVETLASEPAVLSVALTNHGPGGMAGLPAPARLDGVPGGSDDDLSVLYRTVSDGYFRTVGTPVVQGRELTPEDLLGGEGPVVVNQALASRWPDGRAVGRELGVLKSARTRADFGEPLRGRVVGVVADLDPSETGGQEVPTVYVPFTHSPWAQVRLLVRVRTGSAEVLRSLEEAVRRVEPGIPLSGPFVGLQRMSDVRASARADERFNAVLVGAFALMALLLASVGMYGVVSFTVARRTRAIGVRMALGASPSRVVLDVVRRVAIVAGLGLAVGAVAAVALSRFATVLLYEVEPVHALAYGSVALLLLGLALAAGYGPARRAGRLDPAAVLRSD